jgi:iron complex transport system substrate-binding protein
MRVVSLVPAATEIACALGATGELVAVTHDDDFPPEVLALPRVTRSTIPPHATARQIDTLVREAGGRGESTFHLDEAALREARPDVILGQTLCAVCAVTLERVPTFERPPVVVALEASSLEGMLEDVRRVGDALGREREAAALIGSLRARIDAVRSSVDGADRPRVACLEWLDPIFNGGHWVPEQVAIAGGLDVLGRAGDRSREISYDDVVTSRPDIVIAMPCGWDAKRAAREAERLGRIVGARIFGVDGAAYFSRPGPRLVDGIELLGSILHPDRISPPKGALAIELSPATPLRTRR